MYEVFYKLTAEPFRLSPDHKFCFGHKSYARARAYMAYAFNRAEGFVMITGRPGTGKTTLIGELVENLADDKVYVANLVCTQLQADDLLKSVAYSFGIGSADLDKAELLQRLTVLLNRWHRESRRALLIVDEAQDLSITAMEELRLLTNIQLGGQPLLQIFLLGQPELRDLILSPEMEQVHQRIVAASHIDGLEKEELESYVMHRLQVVGWQGDPAIDRAIFPLLHKFSDGVPRRINLICSRLFLLGSVEERHAIEVKDVGVVIEELQGEGLAAGTGFSAMEFQPPARNDWVPVSAPVPAGSSQPEPDPGQRVEEDIATHPVVDQPGMDETAVDPGLAGTSADPLDGGGGGPGAPAGESPPDNGQTTGSGLDAAEVETDGGGREPEVDEAPRPQQSEGPVAPDDPGPSPEPVLEPEPEFIAPDDASPPAPDAQRGYGADLEDSYDDEEEEFFPERGSDQRTRGYGRWFANLGVTLCIVAALLFFTRDAIPPAWTDRLIEVTGSRAVVELVLGPGTATEEVPGFHVTDTEAGLAGRALPPANSSGEETIPPEVVQRDDFPSPEASPATAAGEPAQPEAAYLVNFSADSELLESDAWHALDSVAVLLRERPGHLALVTDLASGPEGDSPDPELSAARVSAVEQYLVAAGIDRHRLLGGVRPGRGLAAADGPGAGEEGQRVRIYIGSREAQ
jgi:putative secretion ATPase (PEP-CTERM system associated)